MDQMETISPPKRLHDIDHMSRAIGEIPYDPWQYTNRPTQKAGNRRFEDYYKSPEIDHILDTLPKPRPTDEYLRPELVAKAQEESLGLPGHNARKQLEELDKRTDADFLRKNLSREISAIILFPGLVLTGSERHLTQDLADALHTGNMTAINKALLTRSTNAANEANELESRIKADTVARNDGMAEFYKTDIQRLRNLAQTTHRLSQILEKFQLVDTRPPDRWEDAINTPNTKTLKIA